MSGGVVPIGDLQLVLAALFMVVAAATSFRLGLGLAKDIAISTLRVFLQLLALGLVLRYLFEFQTWWLVLAMLVLMTVSATLIARGRVKKGPKGLEPALFLSLFITGFTVTFAVTGLVIGSDPWYSARNVITIGGMVLGNSMSAAAVALDRLFADLDARSDEIFTLTALGATAYESARPSIVASIRAGLIPTLSSMAAAGIVFIPGMMTGQILAGADPFEAAKYQIVVLLMISAATTICNVIVVHLAYRKRFSEDELFLSAGLRETR